MTKKHFIALADVLRDLRPIEGCHAGRGIPHTEHCYQTCLDSWRRLVNQLAQFCQAQNGNFNRERWLAYVAGTVGPNGGKK
jgi:hypothetical protein